MRLILATLILTFTAQLASFADSIGFGTSTITTKILAIESANANAMRSEFKTQDIIPYKFKVKGVTYDGILLTISGHAKVFKETGGPYLRWLGLDFRSFTDPRKVYFYIYTGLLVFMIGLHWFSMISATSTGKGKFEVIPLALKLIMGLVVAYNLPFVYGVAMSLKDLGTQIVAMAISNENSAETLLKSSSNAPIILNARQEAIIDGVKKALPSLIVPITEVKPKLVPVTETYMQKVGDGGFEPRQRVVPGKFQVDPAEALVANKNSGRARVAALTVALNQRIGKLYSARFVTLADPSGSRIGPGTINFVGFPKRTETEPARSITNPYAQAEDEGASGILEINEALRPDVINQKFAYNEATTNYLYDKYVERLGEYMTILGSSYSQVGERDAKELTEPSALNSIRLLENGGVVAGVEKEFALGDILYPIDASLINNQHNNADLKTYRAAVADAVSSWMLRNPGIMEREMYVKTLPDNAPDKTGWFSWAEEKIGNVIAKIPQMIADLFVGITKWFWIPALSYLATFVFNFTIEFYVYLLWLAYPLWFYKKTEKAFTGALDTLVSMCFTVMTFCLLTYTFEAFAGWLRSSLTTGVTLGVVGTITGAGGAAAGTAFSAGAGAIASGGGIAGASAAVAGAAYGVPIVVGMALGATLAIGIGFSAFYIVGTFLCFRLAPKVFQAFKEGSSVVTPMVGAAATAMVSGFAGAVLAGVGGGALAASLVGAAKGSAVLGGMGRGIAAGASKLGAGAKNVVSRAGGSQVAGYVRSRAGSISRGAAKVGGVVRGVASTVANTRGGRMVVRGSQAVGQAVSSDVSAVTGGVAKKAKEFMADPMSGISRLAQSKVAQVAIVTASGFGGDPSAPLKNLGTAIVATETLRRLGGQQSTSSPANKGDYSSESSQTTAPASANAPTTAPAGTSPAPSATPTAPTAPSQNPSTLDINAGVINLTGPINIPNIPTGPGGPSTFTAPDSGSSAPSRIDVNVDVKPTPGNAGISGGSTPGSTGGGPPRDRQNPDDDTTRPSGS